MVLLKKICSICLISCIFAAQYGQRSYNQPFNEELAGDKRLRQRKSDTDKSKSTIFGQRSRRSSRRPVSNYESNFIRDDFRSSVPTHPSSVTSEGIKFLLCIHHLFDF